MAAANSMNDVYATAISIQNHLDALIRERGKDIYSSLYESITDVLMRLETLINEYDSYQTAIGELNCTIQLLDAEKRNKVIEEQKYQQVSIHAKYAFINLFIYYIILFCQNLVRQTNL